MSYLNCADQKSSPSNDNRVATAYFEKENRVTDLLYQKKIALEKGIHVFLRAFKKEEILEVWAKRPQETSYQNIINYPFCKSSGQLGPKRKEGDLQIPEGFYHINRFNPKSLFYLSLGLNYPNSSDRLLADPEQPGSDIFIHGKCQTVGCIPITDNYIKELYIFATEAQKSGQKQIPVHIFPAKMTGENLLKIGQQFPEHQAFWLNLQEGYQWFEQQKILPVVKVDATGKYYFLER